MDDHGDSEGTMADQRDSEYVSEVSGLEDHESHRSEGGYDNTDSSETVHGTSEDRNENLSLAQKPPSRSGSGKIKNGSLGRNGFPKRLAGCRESKTTKHADAALKGGANSQRKRPLGSKPRSTQRTFESSKVSESKSRDGRVKVINRGQEKACENCGYTIMKLKNKEQSRWKSSCRSCLISKWTIQEHEESFNSNLQSEADQPTKKGIRARKMTEPLNEEGLKGSKKPRVRRKAKPFPLRDDLRKGDEILLRSAFGMYEPSPSERKACSLIRDNFVHWDDNMRTRIGLFPFDPPLGSRFLCQTSSPVIMFRTTAVDGRPSVKWNEYLGANTDAVLGKTPAEKVNEQHQLLKRTPACGMCRNCQPNVQKTAKSISANIENSSAQSNSTYSNCISDGSYVNSDPENGCLQFCPFLFRGPTRMGYSFKLGSPRQILTKWTGNIADLANPGKRHGL